jgi:hypothetical protein
MALDYLLASIASTENDQIIGPLGWGLRSSGRFGSPGDRLGASINPEGKAGRFTTASEPGCFD